jgi:hypothetical protein
VNNLTQICKDYFGEEIVIPLPPYHGRSYSSQVSRDIHDTFRVQDARDFEGILFQELLTSGRWSVFVHDDTGNTSVKPDAEEMCCEPSSYMGIG